MTLDRPTEDRVIGAVTNVCTSADKLRQCEDLDALRTTLLAVRAATIRAYQTIQDAEEHARRAALARTFA